MGKTNKSGKTEDYRTKIQKSVLLFTGSELLEHIINNSVYINNKTTKTLGILKGMRNPYIENYKTLMKEIKEYKVMERPSCSLIGRKNTVKVSTAKTNMNWKRKDLS